MGSDLVQSNWFDLEGMWIMFSFIENDIVKKRFTIRDKNNKVASKEM